MNSKPILKLLPIVILALATCHSAFADLVNTFNVRDYGAVGNGLSPDTASIQKALEDCGKEGGGVVQFPAGTYLSAPLEIQSNTTMLLEKGATLLATTNQSEFLKVPGNWQDAKSGGDFVHFLTAKDAENVAITGEGTIDGNGHVWWEAAEEARRKVSGYTLPRPNLIVITRCKNLEISGITIQNSPKFHFVPTDCEDVLVNGVTFLAPERAPNTDAIDPSVSRRVTITNCVIDVGDDNVAIKSGKKMPGREFACEDITVVDCTFRHGHGMSIGSETVGGVRNLTVERCTFDGTEYGLRIKSPRGRGGRVENIRYVDITMTNVDPAITITAYYPKIPVEDTVELMTDKTPQFKNIEIRNLKAVCPNEAGVIVGLPESIARDVRLENVHITAESGLTIRNAENVRLKGVEVTVKKGPPIIEQNAEIHEE